MIDIKLKKCIIKLSIIFNQDQDLFLNPYNGLFADNNIPCFYEVSADITFSGYKRGILYVNLNNVNLDDANISRDDPKNIINVWLLAWNYISKQRKASKREIKNKINACSLASNKMMVRWWG